jgi:hypothetical protein
VTAVSFRINRGTDGFKMSDVVVGADAPTASVDVEIRWQVLDQQGKNMNDWELIKACKAFIRWFETNGGLVSGNQVTGITTQPSGPPN